MTYIPSRLRTDDYETRREADDLDRIRDWPGSQDTEAGFCADDPACEAVEASWLQTEIERVAAEQVTLRRREAEDELGKQSRGRVKKAAAGAGAGGGNGHGGNGNGTR